MNGLKKEDRLRVELFHRNHPCTNRSRMLGSWKRAYTQIQSFTLELSSLLETICLGTTRVHTARTILFALEERLLDLQAMFETETKDPFITTTMK